MLHSQENSDHFRRQTRFFHVREYTWRQVLEERNISSKEIRRFIYNFHELDDIEEDLCSEDTEVERRPHKNGQPPLTVGKFVRRRHEIDVDGKIPKNHIRMSRKDEKKIAGALKCKKKKRRRAERCRHKKRREAISECKSDTSTDSVPVPVRPKIRFDEGKIKIYVYPSLIQEEDQKQGIQSRIKSAWDAVSDYEIDWMRVRKSIEKHIRWARMRFQVQAGIVGQKVEDEKRAWKTKLILTK